MGKVWIRFNVGFKKRVCNPGESEVLTLTSCESVMMQLTTPAEMFYNTASEVFLHSYRRSLLPPSQLLPRIICLAFALVLWLSAACRLGLLLYTASEVSLHSYRRNCRHSHHLYIHAATTDVRSIVPAACSRRRSCAHVFTASTRLVSERFTCSIRSGQRGRNLHSRRSLWSKSICC